MIINIIKLILTDKMTNIMRMLQSQQSRRLDEQRVSMTSLPGFQRIGSDGNNIQVINNQPQESSMRFNSNIFVINIKLFNSSELFSSATHDGKLLWLDRIYKNLLMHFSLYNSLDC